MTLRFCGNVSWVLLGWILTGNLSRKLKVNLPIVYRWFGPNFTGQEFLINKLFFLIAVEILNAMIFPCILFGLSFLFTKFHLEKLHAVRRRLFRSIVVGVLMNEDDRKYTLKRNWNISRLRRRFHYSWRLAQTTSRFTTFLLYNMESLQKEILTFSKMWHPHKGWHQNLLKFVQSEIQQSSLGSGLLEFMNVGSRLTSRMLTLMNFYAQYGLHLVYFWICLRCPPRTRSHSWLGQAKAKAVHKVAIQPTNVKIFKIVNYNLGWSVPHMLRIAISYVCSLHKHCIKVTLHDFVEDDSVSFFKFLHCCWDAIISCCCASTQR